jgi:hypothetical protein
MLYEIFYHGYHECMISFDSDTRNLRVNFIAVQPVYQEKKLKVVTLYRITKAWPECDEDELYDSLTGLVNNWNEDHDDDEELQLIAFTLIYRRYGTAFVF